MLGHQATEEKSNEITAIPLLLKHLDLKDALVTMDAMGTQTDIARAIRDGGGVVSPLTLKWLGGTLETGSVGRWSRRGSG
jgi:predicted transposase YbfD/YdcC